MAAEQELQERISAATAAVASRAYLGGELQAAFYQGFDELGAALKAFPDSIQREEPGTAFNPLYRDRSGNDRRNVHGGPAPTKGEATVMNDQPMPTPSQIIDNPGAYLPQGQGQEGNVMGQEKGQAIDGAAPPSPSQIIENPQAYLTPEQQPGQQHEHGQER